jgi:hypothetical protein
MGRNQHCAKLSIFVVCSVPFNLEILSILLVLGLHCTAARISSSPHRRHEYFVFAHGKEPVFLKAMCTFSNVLLCGIL